ncbi:hypothetical protein VNO80_24050 [Phaseolus coccineus]|uniref:SAM-dependent methyltransferase Erg6/SMT-type domain-containing protein n=1 Tax=Phaseolus coccineus TaxID=3886 RepID=A0AAN9LRU8_PHACN
MEQNSINLDCELYVKEMEINRNIMKKRNVYFMYEKYHACYGGEEEERKANYADMVNKYYDLATTFYEFGWGQSFHFAPRCKGESLSESIKRHEHFLALQLGLKAGQKVYIVSQMTLMLGHIPRVLDLIWSWIAPTEDNQNVFSKVKCLENLCKKRIYVGKETPWLASTDRMYESAEPVFLELHATATRCLPSGECLCPDATVWTTLTTALYSSAAGDEVVLNRQLMVRSSKDNPVKLWDAKTGKEVCSFRRHKNTVVCVKWNQNGNWALTASKDQIIKMTLMLGDIPGVLDLMWSRIAPTEDNQNVPFYTVDLDHKEWCAGSLFFLCSKSKKLSGEPPRFQAGVTMEISRLDAWYSDKDGSLECPATYIVKGLCRRCCLPEVILLCMQEFLLFERECSICKMEITEE